MRSPLVGLSYASFAANLECHEMGEIVIPRPSERASNPEYR